MKPQQAIDKAFELMRSGKRTEARLMLRECLASDPENETLWLALANISDSQREKITCLKQVLRINPNNEMAQKGLCQLEQAQWQDMKENKFFYVVRRTLREGDRDTVRRALQWKLERDPNSAEAWMLAHDASDTEEARRECLNRVIEINPKHYRVDMELRKGSRGRDKSGNIKANSPLGMTILLIAGALICLVAYGFITDTPKPTYALKPTPRTSVITTDTPEGAARAFISAKLTNSCDKMAEYWTPSARKDFLEICNLMKNSTTVDSRLVSAEIDSVVIKDVSSTVGIPNAKQVVLLGKFTYSRGRIESSYESVVEPIGRTWYVFF